VTGSGSDIWGTADEFHYFSREVTGDFDFSARAAAIDNVHAWTKAGLMLRAGLAANAQHAFAIATPGSAKGVAFQRRPTTGGTSAHTAGPAAAPPAWLRLVRAGSVVSAYYRPSSHAVWTLVDSQMFPSLPATVRVGFAVGSHVDGTLATATFDEVALQVFNTPVFESSDVGAVGAAGSSSTDASTYTVTGSGGDVWGTADELHYFSRPVTGDFVFTARAASVEAVHAWSKAGLMMRESLAADARHAFVIQTPGTTKGVAFQRRPTTGGTSVHTAGPAAAPPGWLRLARRGNIVTAYHSSSGPATWALIGSETFSALPATVRVGFAMGSHVDGTLATAVFDSVTLTQ
jgi:regulation of enolase protein 1 (concanavalin A-like superfamily)